MMSTLCCQGRHLNLVLSDSDISVTIGSEDCHVTSMSATQLTCKPSLDDVGGMSHVKFDSKPIVVVRVSYDVMPCYFIIDLLNQL